jgi:preprotein translocase subunit SecG
MSILINLFTVILIITSIVLILLVLMQKAKSDGGMGAAMGGGAAEATFGADTGNVLSKLTINASIVFFVLSFGLYLGRIYEGKHAATVGGSLPTISVPVSATSKAPAAPAASVGLPIQAKIIPAPAAATSTATVPAAAASTATVPAQKP